MPHLILQRTILATIASLMAVAALTTAASAQITPIAVGASGFNNDDVYNGTGADTAQAYFDNLNKYAFYSQGANTGAPTSGLPASGLLTTGGGSTYQLQSYLNNNVVQVSGSGAGTPFPTTGTLTLTTAGRYSSVGVLSASAFGPVTLNVTFNYVGGTTSTVSYSSSDWFTQGQAYTAYGRVSGFPTAPSYQNFGNAPGLFETTFSTNSSLALQSVTFTANNAATSTGQSTSIFAISGVAAAPEPGSVALAGLGLLGIVAPVISRRRK